MSDTERLLKRIDGEVAKSEAQRETARRHLGQRMEEIDQATREFNEVAERLTQSVVRPRMSVLADRFENAELVPTTPGQPFQTLCRFRFTERLVGPGLFGLSIDHDDETPTRIRIDSRIRFFPEFLHSNDCRSYDFERPVNDRVVGEWVDDRIVDCVDTMLQLTEAVHGRDEYVVRDPVCGMHFPKAYAAAEEQFDGVFYYFCTEHCREEFAANPAGFAVKP